MLTRTVSTSRQAMNTARTARPAARRPGEIILDVGHSPSGALSGRTHPFAPIVSICHAMTVRAANIHLICFPPKVQAARVTRLDDRNLKTSWKSALTPELGGLLVNGFR